MGDFHQPGIDHEHRRTRLAQRQFRGAPRARKRRSDGAVDTHVMQALAERRGLAFADWRQRDVFLALVAAFGVPWCFAVAGEQDSHVFGSVARGAAD